MKSYVKISQISIFFFSGFKSGLYHTLCAHIAASNTATNDVTN